MKLMVSAVQRMACLHFMMPRDSVGKTQTARWFTGVGARIIWRLLHSHVCAWAVMTGKLGSPGTFGWSIYTWPFHVAWTAHRVAAGVREGERGSIWRASIPRDQANAAWPLMAVASEVTWNYFCHTLIGWTVSSPHRFRGGDIDPTSHIGEFPVIKKKSHI